MAEVKKEPPTPFAYPKVKIKFKDVFNFKEFYVVMYSWLKSNQWIDKTTGGQVEFMEEFHLEKTGATGAKEHIIYWEVEKKRTDYIKFSMSISISTIFLNQTEIMKEGKKIKTNIGEIKVEITARLHSDYKAEWTNHWLLGPFQKKIEETVFKNEMEAEEDKLYKQLYEFQSEIKRYLQLQQFMGSGTEFIPAKEV